MKIYYDKEKTKEIERRIWEKYGGDTKKWAEGGYNVSECTGCEMKCYNHRCAGLKQNYTKQNIGFLVFGIIAEQVVMAIYPEEQHQWETNVNELVWGHIDVFEDFKYPVEGKATAKRIFKREQLPVKWVIQLLNYITSTGAPKGWLIILDIFSRQFSVWCLEVTGEDTLMQIEVLMDKVSRFDKKDPSILTFNPEEYNLCSYKRECERKVECRTEWKKLDKAKKEARKRKKQHKKQSTF